MMATLDLDRLAGLSSWVALIALVLAGIALALFFGGAGQFWGPVNDSLTVVTAIALIPAVLAIARAAGDRAAPWVTLITVAAIAGLILIAVGQTLLVIGRLSLEGSYVTGGIGVIPVIAWMVLVAVLAIAGDALPREVGWLAIASLVGIIVISVAAAMTSGPFLWASGVGLLVVLSLWIARLAIAFGDRAATA